MRLCAWLVAAALLGPWAAWAQTVYLTDRLEVPLRADFTEEAAPVKTLESGASLEVLERYGSQVRVRDKEGTEGWLDGNVVTTQPPAREQLRSLKTDLDRTRRQVVQLQTELDRAQAAPAEAPADQKKLETELADTRAELARTQAALAQAQARPAPDPEPVPPPAETASSGDESGSAVLWVLVSFAMLLVGFVAGIIWVRESIRRRMGGMYLRV